jgi:hypothetical protein
MFQPILKLAIMNHEHAMFPFFLSVIQSNRVTFLSSKTYKYNYWSNILISNSSKWMMKCIFDFILSNHIIVRSSFVLNVTFLNHQSLLLLPHTSCSNSSIDDCMSSMCQQMSSSDFFHRLFSFFSLHTIMLLYLTNLLIILNLQHIQNFTLRKS